MGFFIMLFSMILGIALIVVGAFHKKSSSLWKYSIGIGVIFVIFSIWLGLPK